MKFYKVNSLEHNNLHESRYSNQNRLEKKVLKNKLADDPQFTRFFDTNASNYSVLHHPFGHPSLDEVKSGHLNTCVYIPNQADNKRYAELMHKMLEHSPVGIDFIDYICDLAEQEVIVYKSDGNAKIVKLKDATKELGV